MVHPNVAAILLTPICAHSLSFRFVRPIPCLQFLSAIWAHCLVRAFVTVASALLDESICFSG
jgi:hypothetical protein